MTQQEELHQKIDALPHKYLSEVIDFIGYLQYKAQQERSDTEFNQETREWVNPLLGLGSAMGSTLTLERFREMQQEEIVREIENDNRLWGKE